MNTPHVISRAFWRTLQTGIFALFLTLSSFAVTTTFTAVADTTIKSDAATTNFGTAAVLEHDAYPADFASLLRFDLSSIPSNATVTAVSLTLYVTNSSPASFQLYGLNRAFNESQATWNQAASGVSWGTAGATNSSDRDSTDFGPVIGSTANASVTVNLNSAGVTEVQSWVANSSVNYGFIIQNYNNSTNGDGLDVASREATTASQRPQLTVTYTVASNSVPDITTTTLPGGTQGVAYSQTLAATGGDGALVWSLASGTLPGGLTLSSGGVISGTPSATGTFNFTVRVADSDAVTGATDEDTQALSIVVVSGGGGGSTSVTFRDGENSYAGTTDTTIKSDATSTNFGGATLLENDGTPAYSSLLRFDLSSIPSGATVSAASLTFHVSNLSNQSYQIYALNRAFAEGSATWNVAASGSNWQTAGASGSADRGSTVLGTINGSSTGAITVTLNSDGIAKVQSWVTNSGDNHGFVIQNYSNTDGLDLASSEASTISQRPRLSVTYTSSGGGGNSVPNITTTSLPNGAQNVGYSQTLAATGGDGALIWSLASGALPSGLSLSSAGVISGTPTTTGTSNFTVRVADSDAVTGASDEDTQALTLIVGTASSRTLPGAFPTPACVEPEAQSRVPVIQIGTDLYRVTESQGNASNGINRPMMMRSTDGGQTWTEQNATNRPSIQDLECVWVERDGTGSRINVAVNRGSSANWVQFDTSTNQWLSSSAQTIDSGFGVSGHKQWISQARTSDGQVWAFYSTTTSSSSQRLSYKRRDTSGVWSSTRINLESSGSWTSAVSVVGKNDLTHIFYQDYANGTLVWRTLTNAGTLSSATVIDTNTPSGSSLPTPHTNAVYYQRSNGDEVIYIAYVDTSDILWGVAITNGVVGTRQQLSSSAVLTNPSIAENEGAVAHLTARDDEVHILWTDNSTGDIFYRVRFDDNSLTTTATAWNSGSDRADWIYSSLHTWDGQTYLGYTYDLDHADDMGEIKFNAILLPQ